MIDRLINSLSACRRFFSLGANASSSSHSNVKPSSYALNNLDLKLLEHISYAGGFFIEAGANDGLQQSNTLLLEKKRQWSGLLIEPVPYLADKCRINRPKCKVANAALVPFGFDEVDIEMWTCGLMSFVDGAFKTTEEASTHLKNSQLCEQPKPNRCSVAARTLSSILDEHNIKHVDLLSLDVEGYEASALRGIDFKRHVIDYILVEARYREDIEQVLLPMYRLAAELTARDLLYRRVG